MWLLQNKQSGDCFYILNEQRQYTVGRVGSDLVLLGDTSISRLHAHLNVYTIDSTIKVELTEAGSKYGTFYKFNIEDNVRLKKDESVMLCEGDEIRFGLLKNLWTVSQHRFISVASTLTLSQKEEFMILMQQLGGTVPTHFTSDCTHVTMCTFKVTLKALHALLEQRPIVTVDYWKALLRAAKNGAKELPAPADYMPPNDEELLQGIEYSLATRLERRRLFCGFVFVFMNRKQQDTYEPIVVKAGATCKNLRDGVPKKYLIKKGVIVVQYVPSTQSQSSQTLNVIEEYLASQSVRIIPEHEIGLAIVHCSTEQFCNPKYKEPVHSMQPIPERIIDDLFPESIQFSSAFVAEEIQKSASSAVTVSSTSDDEQMQPETEIRKKRKRNVNRCHVLEEANKETNENVCAKKPHLDVLPENSENQRSIMIDPSTSSKRQSDSLVAENKVTQISAIGVEEETETSSLESTGFLQKRIVVTRSQKKEADTTASAFPDPNRKRTRVRVITDDDDDDDLFGFGDSDANAKRVRFRGCAAKNDSDDELFGFKDTPKDTVDKPTSNVKETAQSDQQESVEPVKVRSGGYVNIPIKPYIASTEGWLSCNRNKQRDADKLSKIDIVKTEINEDSAKSENETTSPNKTPREWIDMLKGGCEVRLNLCVVSAHKLSESDELSMASDKTTTNKGTVTNSKTFVKKKNLCLQKTVIKTTSVPIGMPLKIRK